MNVQRMPRNLFDKVIHLSVQNPDEAFRIVNEFIESHREQGKKIGWTQMFALTSHPEVANGDEHLQPAAEWLATARADLAACKADK